MKKLKLAIAAIVLVALIYCVTACSLTGNEEEKVSYDLSGEAIGYRLTSDPDPIYDGKPKTRNFVLTYDGARIENVNGAGGNSDLKLEYFDNVNAGIAKIKVTPADGSTKYKGELVVEFPILASSEVVTAESFEQLEALLSPANYGSVQLAKDVTVPDGKQIIISKGVTLLLNTFTLSNFGSIINEGEIYFNQKDDGKVFAYNDGEFVNDGKIYLGSNSAFFNRGMLENLEGGQINASGQSGVYSDTDITSEGYIKNYYRRYPIEEFDLKLSFEEAVYTGENIVPFVKITKEGITVSGGDYSTEYSDNLNAGRARVSVIADEYSKTMTGSTVLYFDILRASVNVSSASDISVYFADSNYDEVNYYGSTVFASFEVPEGYTLNFKKSATVRGNIVNNGTIVASGDVTLEGDFLNNGNVTVNSDYFSYEKGEFVNCGNFSTGGRFLNSSSIVNSGEFATGGPFYNKGVLQDSGQMTIEGKFYNGPDCAVTSIGGIDNADSAYVDEDNGAFKGNTVVRVFIQESDVSLDTLEFVYDSSTKKAFPVFNGIQPNSGAYSSSYRYSGASADVSSPVNAGRVAVTVTFGIYSEYYKGSCVLYYDILAGSCSVNTLEEITDAFNNPNYDTVELQRGLTLSEDFEIPEDYTLRISEGAHIVNKSLIDVWGTLINDGKYADSNLDCKFVLGQSGAFVNNGEAYVNDGMPEGVSGDGIVYLRKDIAQTTAVDFPESVDYGQFPEVYLEDNGVPLVVYEDYIFYHIDGNYATPDGRSAKAVSLAGDFSKKYYGTKIDEYRVLAVSVEINKLSELLIALDSRHPEEDFCNYSEVILNADIEVVNDNPSQPLILKVAANTTVVLGNYSLKVRSEISDKIYFVNNGNIVTEKKTILRNGVNYSGSGTVTGYASTADELKEYAECMDVIVLTADVSDAIMQPFGADCTLDINGHNINRLQVSFGYNSLTITSSVAGGTLGSAESSDYGLYTGADAQSTTTVTIENITVYGINYLSVSHERIIIAPTCTVVEKT